MRYLWVGMSVCAILLGAGAAQAAAPVIERVDLVEVRGNTAWDPPFSGSRMSVLVSDADGADDLASVDVNGRLYTTDMYGGGFAWTREGADTLRFDLELTQAYLAEGPYLITVADQSDVHATATASPPVMPEPAPVMVSPAGEFPVITDPNLTFSWTGIDPSGDDLLVVSRVSDREVWRYDPGTATSAPYNTDGTALDATLQPGFSYRWQLTSRRAVDDGETDPRVHTYADEWLRGSFIIYSATPVIEDVTIYRYCDTDGGGRVRYGHGAVVFVTDCGGYSRLESVVITDPAGAAHAITSSGYPYWRVADTYSVKAFFGPYRPLSEFTPPQTGTYTIVLTNTDLNTATLVTPPAGNPPPAAILLPPDGAVLEDTRPLLRWDTGLPATHPSLFAVGVQGTGGRGYWSSGGTGDEIEYTGGDTYYAYLAAPLEPGHNCAWYAWARTPMDDGETDPRVRILADQFVRGRFSMHEPWPALPALDGKLAFATLVAGADPSWADISLIEQYDPDPWARRWLGPVSAAFPDWSLDGTKLLFVSSGIWVDQCDGTAPALVVEEASDPRWSPDGTQIVFARQTGWVTSDIWIVNADGSGAHPLVESDATKRYPAWSPDGQWIAYGSLSSSAPSTDGVWLVRPDGTEPHHLLPTGVQDYSGYAVTYLGQPGWAPDAGRLVVTFSAFSDEPGAPGLHGLGVVSRDGGLLKPVFLTPEGVVCCPEPKLPVWSGDGTKIAFSSGHHLPVNPQWASGSFESGVELWMINADGSGEPTRLTYNHGFDGTTSWWAPPPFPDVPKGYWAYCAISTCAQAGLVQGFPSGNYQPLLPVTRDQMAVYIARALAGGEDHVPSGPAAATFGDVDQEHWAFRYVEYCAANGIVQGYWDGSYRPGEVVTRDQMAAYVSRTIATPTGEAGLEGYAAPDTPSFTDVAADHWAYRYIEYAAAHGIVQGYGDASYRPALPVTRDQMAMYIARAFRLPM
jgi:hypothetical protein